jgi:hypothetical protein
MKTERILREKANELGLKYLGLENRSKHARMSFRNREGKVLVTTTHYTDRENYNIKKDIYRLKRFAECEYLPTMLVV